jgi:hypothetical protein
LRRSKPKDPFRVVAVISAFNEADIISSVIGHLVENGVDVYLLDNRSTDDTVEQARPWLGRGLLKIEEFPETPPPGEGPPPFDWGAILKRKEELTQELDADWFIHHDADEIREAPWPGMRLREAIAWVDRLGYNCIDFRVLNFPPVDEGFKPGMDPATYYTRWEDPQVFDLLQLKCWKARAGPVSLIASAGHEVSFPNRQVFPIRFLLRHYPIRSPEHGRRKVFAERKARFLEGERARTWHIQYDGIEDESHSFLADPHRLHPFDSEQVRLELMLQNQATRNAEASRDLREQELAGLREQHASLEQEAGELRRLRVELERQLSNLENGDYLSERERRVADLQNAREALAQQIARLEDERSERDRRMSLLEDQRLDQERRATQLERENEKLEHDIQESSKSLEGSRRIERELRLQVERYAAFHRALEHSAAWRILQYLRRLVGRAW